MQQHIDFNSIDTFTLDDHLVLFREGGRRILILNPLAKYIWHASESGSSSEEIARDVSQAFDIPFTLALQDVTTVKAQWSMELFETSTGKNENHSRFQVPRIEAGFLDNGQPLAEATYAFPHFAVRVRYDSPKIINTLESILGVMKAPFTDGIDYHIDVVTHEKHYVIINGGDISETADTEEDAAILIFQEIVKLHGLKGNWLAVLQAAGVAWKNHGIIFPAANGSGKTTLVAVLLRHGFDYLNDNIIPVERETHRLVPLPVCLCIKSGSWEVLAASYPELEKLRSYRLSDTAVKYLRPPKHVSGESTCQARYLVIPHYQDGANHHLQKISAAEGLQVIIEGLIQPVKSDEIAEIILWISKLRCYRLTYNDLNAAIETMTQLVSTEA